MKRRYRDGGEVDAMEEANNRYIDELMSKPAPKEMGDASVAEEAGQFGEAGSSRTVKATPKDKSKAPKSEARDTGSDVARMISRGKSAEMPSGKPGGGKSAEMPADVSKMSANERMKRSVETNLSGARSGSGPTDKRSANERIKAMFGMKSGGMTASKRGDGIAQRGKTRGKMC